MTVEVVENCTVPEIFADELAQIHVNRNVMRFCYWTWQMGPGGILQRVVVARMAMPIEGVLASRPKISAAMEKQNQPRVSCLADMNIAH